jgi:integrase
MRGRQRLTELTVSRTKPPAEGRLEFWDAALPGFGLRITANGAKSYVIAVRKPGSQHPVRIKIGNAATMPLGQARARARKALADPDAFFADRDAEVAARQPKVAVPDPDPVASVIRRFIERHQRPRNRSWQEVERILVRELKPWAERPIRDLTRREIIELVDATADRAPVMANRLLTHLRTMFAWAIERGILEASPADGIRPPGREVSRDRVLTDHELVAVWRACDALGWPMGPLVRLLIVTGQRRDEVGGMRWADLDLERRLWRIPPELVKTGQPHDVPLSSLAFGILAGLPRIGDREHVFPASRGRGNPVSGFSAAKRRLDTLSKVGTWRFHDLRRTMATGLQRLGVPLEHTEAVLGHTAGSRRGIIGIYQRHHYGPEKRRALEAWSREIERLLGVEAKVVNVEFNARALNNL